MFMGYFYESLHDARVYLSEDEEKSAEAESKRLWQAMKPVVQEMVTELQRSVSYFHSQLEGGRIDKVLLAGGCSRLRNFDLFLKDQLGTDVKKLDPLKKIAFSPEVFEGEDPESELGVAIGLALAQFKIVVMLNVMTWLIPILLIVLGTETALNTILDFYRPRIAGQYKFGRAIPRFGFATI